MQTTQTIFFILLLIVGLTLMLCEFYLHLVKIYFNEYNNDIIKPTEAKIFCIIITSRTTIDTSIEKLITINNTWAKECDKYFFIAKFSRDLDYNSQKSIEHSEFFPLLEPAGLMNDSYASLTHKVYFTFKDLYNRYNNFDWYLKADDDTFIFMANLRKFLRDKNSSAPVTYGYDFKIAINYGYHSGGAGYLLSREAMMRFGKKLNESFEKCSFIGLEDQDVADTLRTVGVYPNKSIDENGYERFHPFTPEAHLLGKVPDGLIHYASNPVQHGPECCSNTSISFHYMTSENIKKLYRMWTNFQNGKKYRSFTKMLYDSII